MSEQRVSDESVQGWADARLGRLAIQAGVVRNLAHDLIDARATIASLRERNEQLERVVEAARTYRNNDTDDTVSLAQFVASEKALDLLLATFDVVPREHSDGS